MLLFRDYQPKIIHEAFELISCSDVLKRVEKEQSDCREPFVLTYHPSLTSVTSVIKTHWQVMTEQCPRLKRCFKKPSLVAYRQSKNIGNMLIRAKTKTTRKSKRLLKGFSVCKRLCMACPLSGLKPGEKVTSHKCGRTGKIWPITSAIDCQTSNVVYKITCRKPQCRSWVYIRLYLWVKYLSN